VIGQIRVMALIALVFTAVESRGQTGIEAWFAPGEEVTNAVSVGYRFRVVQDTSPNIMILFGWNRLYGPSSETYLLENDAYADGFAYTNQACTTWPEIGTEHFSQSSLRSDIPDYNEHGWIGAQASSPIMFPRQTYWIDGITNLTKMDLITQTNMNGVDCSLQLTRAGLVTNLTGWNCANQLETNVIFREWDATIVFGGATYTNQFALPDANSQYFASYSILVFLTEFFGLQSGAFQVYIYDLTLQSEGQAWSRRVNQFNVYQQDYSPTNHGVRIVSNHGTNVIEISCNVGATDYFLLNTIFDLGVSLNGQAPDLIPLSISAPATAFAGQTIPVTVTLTNATSFAAGSFATGYFLSGDSDVALNDWFCGAATNQAGLAGGGKIVFTNYATIPSSTAPGMYYLGAIVDYPGVIVETVKSNNTVAVPLTVLGCLPSDGPTVTNVWQMPGDFEEYGWLFEDFPDTRANGSPGGSTNVLADLGFAGDLSLQNGTITNEGPGYLGASFFPYVMLDTNNDWLIMHPAGNHGAALGLVVCRTGTFHVNGIFARANDDQFAGDGVDVAVLRNVDTTNLLFSANIPSSAAIDFANLFQGPGAAPFNLTLSLTKGDVLRFAVFSGTNGDNSFDATALEFTASEDPAPTFSVRGSLVGTNLLLSWPGVANETYEILASSDLFSWTPFAQIIGAGTNQFFLPVDKAARFQAFRVMLIP